MKTGLSVETKMNTILHYVTLLFSRSPVLHLSDCLVGTSTIFFTEQFLGKFLRQG